MSFPSLRSKSEQLIQAREEGKTAAEVAELVESLANTAIEDTIAKGDAKAQDNSSTMLSMLRDFDGNIETGFQLANQQGPLCAEPVVGMAYFVEKVEVADMAGQEDTRGCWHNVEQPSYSSWFFLLQSERECLR